jgi:hypothetical protein
MMIKEKGPYWITGLSPPLFALLMVDCRIMRSSIRVALFAYEFMVFLRIALTELYNLSKFARMVQEPDAQSIECSAALVGTHVEHFNTILLDGPYVLHGIVKIVFRP